jgi:DNA anti-recombination protein RmuC
MCLMNTGLLRLSFGLSLLLVAGCDRPQPEAPQTAGERLQRETGEAVDAAGDYAQTAVVDLRARLADQTAKLNERLATLKADTQEGSAALAEETQMRLDQVRAALSRLESATADERERIREETSKVLDDLEAWWKQER